MMYQYLADAPVDELQKSIIYDDYGRTDTFNWDIENGKYNVTVSIGWDGKTYSKNKVVIEGQPLFDNVETNPTTPYQVKSLTVDVDRRQRDHGGRAAQRVHDAQLDEHRAGALTGFTAPRAALSVAARSARPRPAP